MLGGTTFVFTRALVTSLDPLVISFVRYGLIGLLFLIFFFISFKKIIFQWDQNSGYRRLNWFQKNNLPKK